MHNLFDQMPQKLVNRMEVSTVRFNPKWVYQQWYTGMPVDYLMNLMDDLENEAKNRRLITLK